MRKLKRMMSYTRAFWIIGILLMVEPIRALLHEVLVIAVANLLNRLGGFEPFSQLIGSVMNNPVHATLMVETVGGIKPEGIAVAGFLGDWLHASMPTLFLQPEWWPLGPGSAQ